MERGVLDGVTVHRTDASARRNWQGRQLPSRVTVTRLVGVRQAVAIEPTASMSAFPKSRPGVIPLHTTQRAPIPTKVRRSEMRVLCDHLVSHREQIEEAPLYLWAYSVKT